MRRPWRSMASRVPSAGGEPYPFEDTAAGGADERTAVETIDIGGPAMIRAAAKPRLRSGHGRPADYAELRVLDDNDGATSLALVAAACGEGLRGRLPMMPPSGWFAEKTETSSGGGERLAH